MSEPSPAPVAAPDATPAARPTAAGRVDAAPAAGGEPPLPTASQLDELEADLERIDAELVRLDHEG